MSNLTAQEFKSKLGKDYVLHNGEWVHKSHRPKEHVREETPEKTAKLGPEIERASKPKDPEHEDVLKLYSQAHAVLTILNYNAHSINELKWKHWVHHLRERKAAGILIENSGFWKIPFGGSIPQKLETPEKRELAFIRYGGRRLDFENFAGGCKSICDHIKTLGFIHDDSIDWLKRHYHQIPGGEKKLEILFL